MSSPPHGADDALLEAEICAHVIRAWHLTIGTHLAPARLRDVGGARQLATLLTYRDTVARFAAADLSRPASQAELARTQLSGAFEWAYGDQIPPVLWREYDGESRRAQPVSLSDAAHRILHLQESASRVEGGQAQQVEEPPTPGASEERVKIRFAGPDALIAAARRHYAAYTSEEGLGIGGANFLLSCSVERTPALDGEDVVLLPGPTTLGLTMDTSEAEHFLRRVRAGELTIEGVEGN